ncbi:HmuY family protein [Sphingobacteriaceae bacterium WQ 2009]|uniref:HmuY family protein n=1 Tax=Rhinopithecimicrobium faecis TaxID=2820698 RepID=A0A8T4H9D6_9SPHI|nr:HmuY family protein [Sphingobacteriaceae bacterium WQ 2009]
MHKNQLLAGLYLIIGLVMASCSKEQNDPTKNLQDGNSIVISDLAGDINASLGTGVNGKEKSPFKTFLFRFSDQKQQWLNNAQDSANYLPTENWDLAFTGEYNSTLYTNNSLLKDNPAYQGKGTHQIVLLNEAYDKVLVAPSDATFNASTINSFGMAANVNSAGWFSYNMSSHLVSVLPNKTYVLKLSNGQFAKLQMINVYKGNPQAITDLNWPQPYFTFKYFVQKDGSRNLKTN